jgi:hypothetical protein
MGVFLVYKFSSVCDPEKQKFTSKFSYLQFSNPTHKWDSK